MKDKLVNRDAALRVFCEFCGVCPEDKRNPEDCEDIMGHVLVSLPAVDAVEVRHGHWVRHYDADIGWHTCSECGEEIWNPDIEHEKYCWNCGAKMDGADNST